MPQVAFILYPGSPGSSWLPHLGSLASAFRYDGYYTILRDQHKDLLEKVSLLPKDVHLIYVDIPYITAYELKLVKAGLYPLQEGEREIMRLTLGRGVGELVSLVPDAKKRVIFVSKAKNPWLSYQEDLARHLGYDGYYNSFLFSEEYTAEFQPEPMKVISNLDMDIDLIFFATEDTTLPTKMVEVKHPIFKTRNVRSLISIRGKPEIKIPEATGRYRFHGDIHRHILSFLSSRDIAASSRVSKEWRRATGEDWIFWYRISLRDGGLEIKLDDFKKLAATPSESYNESLASSYIEKLGREISFKNIADGAEMYTKLRELTEEDLIYNFRVTLPIFGRIYEVLENLATFDEDYSRSGIVALSRNFGKTANTEDILEFHRLLTNIFGFGQPDEDDEDDEDRLFVDEKLLASWLKKHPSSRPLAQFAAGDGGMMGIMYYVEYIWSEILMRESVLTPLEAWIHSPSAESPLRLGNLFDTFVLNRRTLGLIDG